MPTQLHLGDESQIKMPDVFGRTNRAAMRRAQAVADYLRDALQLTDGKPTHKDRHSFYCRHSMFRSIISYQIHCNDSLQDHAHLQQSSIYH